MVQVPAGVLQVLDGEQNVERVGVARPGSVVIGVIVESDTVGEISGRTPSPSALVREAQC